MILIIFDHKQGNPTNPTLELPTAARRLVLDDRDIAAVVTSGNDAAKAADAATRYVSHVLLGDAPAAAPATHERRAREIARAAEAVGATAILFVSGKSASAVAPRVALRINAALLEDVTTLRRESTAWVAERSAYLTRAILTVRTEQSIVVACLKPGTFEAATPSADIGAVEQLDVEHDDLDVRARRHDPSPATSRRVPLEEAEIIVCGGRGLGDAEKFVQLVEGLADDLGASVASTRAVVDAGWRPYVEQVGQTGKSVSPNLYMALGVSGAVQHLSGMNGSRIVVAINKDPDAPIFKIADYAVVADINHLIPSLRQAISDRNRGDGIDHAVR